MNLTIFAVNTVRLSYADMNTFPLRRQGIRLGWRWCGCPGGDASFDIEFQDEKNNLRAATNLE
eukprot:1294155-Amorphochlora_amoeboformis.AAC.1